MTINYGTNVSIKFARIIVPSYNSILYGTWFLRNKAIFTVVCMFDKKSLGISLFDNLCMDMVVARLVALRREQAYSG